MIQLLYILFCIGLAYVNYRLIIADKRIYHGINALLHLAFWAWVWFYSHDIVLMLMLPFIGRLFFDCSLNLMRGRPIDYVPANPKSWIDKAEKKVFDGDGLIPKGFYFLLIVLLNVIFYV